ncbi:MAG TPA: DUF58 domain-containing protein [Planctomycetota bacterium]|jgi:uncharacterized protein (DUF58 family)|nr:DUF58 domain-containing protein [Planctomycetota bacterium]
MLFDDAFLRKLETLRFAVRRSIVGRREGERQTQRRGGSSGFISHRSYTQGDEFRAIDWNLYGRLGLLYVKEFAKEESLPVRLFIDPSRSMAPKFDFARLLGAALALVANQEGNSIPLRELEALELGSSFVLPTVGRGLAIVVSDLWDESLRPSLSRLHCETAVIHVLSPGETEPALEGKVRMVDAESGESCTRFVGEEERAEYRRLLALHCAEWKRWCFDRDVNYLRCTSATPVEEVVKVYLREAGVLE